jgi:hypothetical protein
MKQLEGIAAAKSFVDAYYPDCLAAVLCGSVARNEATPTSDLDIVIVVHEEIPFQRNTFRDYGWIIESFVGSQYYNEQKIQRPTTNHAPSFLTSWAEGIILKDENNFAQTLKEKAASILNQGPDPLTEQDVDQYRSVIQDWLNDLIDAKSYQESLFIVYELFVKTAELMLASNQQWIGERKWLYRSLQKHSTGTELIKALEHFYRTGEKDRLIAVIWSILGTP